jgi:endonuclease/exonuclease/phosphatase family metal-dependent hydrolase
MANTKTPKTRYEVTANSLNGRTGPSTKHKVKVVRKKGFRFSSTERNGDWVKASSYWYHKGYLKIVPDPKPSPPVTLRLGTLNIPLDQEKLPDGESRGALAAKQIKAMGVDILACQELSRTPGSKSHVYANQLLKALGSEWAMVTPTMPYNENYFFYNKKKVDFLHQEPDLILPSEVRRGHATRAIFTVNNKLIYLYNTHLVNGSKNGPSRETQAQHIAGGLGSFRLNGVQRFTPSTIVMGDFNQSELLEAFKKTHETASVSAQAASMRSVGTYAKWGSYKTTKKKFDHIKVPKNFTVHTYNVAGISSDGKTLSKPRVSDHLLVTALITFK